jgi:hypothetical protein
VRISTGSRTGTYISNRFRILEANDPNDFSDWLAVWDGWIRRDVFAHPAYLRLFALSGDTARCAVWTLDDGNFVLYPFICRSLPPALTGSDKEQKMVDIITPYGYGGPFTWDLEETAAVAHLFWAHFDDWAAGETVVSEFVRFSLFSEDMLPYPGERRESSQNVIRSLDLDEAGMWMDFEPKVRKNVKKAQRNHVSIEIDTAGTGLEAFLDLYYSTMDRRDADTSYYFPRTFFEAIHRELSGHFAYFHAIHESQVVSTELVLMSAENVYSFLGGTNREAFDVRPNDLLKHEIIRWSQSQEKKRFVLGGGREPDDGIFRYKRSFAPRGVVPFVTGQRVLREDLYEALVERRRIQARAEGRIWNEQTSFFPAYRVSDGPIGI